MMDLCLLYHCTFIPSHCTVFLPVLMTGNLNLPPMHGASRRDRRARIDSSQVKCIKKPTRHPPRPAYSRMRLMR